MDEFIWGKVIGCFSYDFDGQIMEVTKYHPWKTDGGLLIREVPDESITLFHCEELSDSSESLQYLILLWITNKNLGLYNCSLVYGVAKALGVIK